jgi:serine/threonine protein kinase
MLIWTLVNSRGSFAVVKVGIPKDGGQNVAIKIIDKKDAQFDKDSLEQEIAIMKKVDHPNCIKLHEVFDEKMKVKKMTSPPPLCSPVTSLIMPPPFPFAPCSL